MTTLPFQLTDLIDNGTEFLDAIFKNITNGVAITDEHSKILYVNPGFTRITGYQYDEAIGQNPGILHSGRHGKAFYESMWQTIHRDGFGSHEIWNRHKTGHLLPEWITITKLTTKNGKKLNNLLQHADQAIYKSKTSEEATSLYMDIDQ